jgi:hypothetical protein
MRRREKRHLKPLLLYRGEKTGIIKAMGGRAHPMAFICSKKRMEGIYLENNEKQELQAISSILEQTEIKNNPFALIPIDQLEKALKVLEEYSEELKF